MILCIAVVGTLLIGCSAKIDSNYKHLTNTAKDGDGVYTDLGDYVIEIADYKDKEFLYLISFCVTDSMNSEGLYMEANVREPYPEFINKGNNPGKTTVYVPMLVAMVTRNCATVKEALDYMRNEINIVSTPYFNNTIPTQYGYYIADATGEYGIIEVIADEVYYLPYASAQGNYYLTPKWAAVETNGTGYGRVQAALDGLEEVDTMEEMMTHMEKSMWKNSVLYMNNAYLDENGTACFVVSLSEKKMLIKLFEKEELIYEIVL